MSFLDRNKVGLLLRTYATKAEDVAERVQSVREFCERAAGMVIDGHHVFSQIDTMVWADKRYSEAACDEMVLALEAALEIADLSPRICHVHYFDHGDLFCSILNYGVATQLSHRVSHSMIASTEALSYLTPETVADMLAAAAEPNVRAVGVALNELAELVMEGRLANTLCLWHNVSLLSVGGFDLRAAKPMDDRTAHYLRGWSEAAGEVYYHLAGVEEVIPLARLVDAHGPCLAPILPRGKGIQQYAVPDPVTQPELWLRHQKKMGTKAERQAALLASVGFDLSFLKGGVMPAYRRR